MSADVVIVGGGVMGLVTAYHASARGASVVVLERGRIGDPATASYGRTRSFRNDYLDVGYGRLAHEAFDLWGEFERETGSTVLVRCGCLNIAKRAVTPDLDGTYAQHSFETLRRLGVPTESFGRPALRERFPYLDADVGHLDVDAGVVDLAAVTHALRHALDARGVRVVEGFAGPLDDFPAGALVVTAGHGTNDVLAGLPGCELQVPITRDRPSEAKYVTPPDPEPFTAGAMPVIAYLDTGIYVHPIVPGVVDAVKIGYYHPPDLQGERAGLDGIASFIAECLPGLREASLRDVEDVDQCDYDLVADDEFVLGAIPGVDDAYVGVGWRGTGYKFAPWVGRVLADCALQGDTGYDIARFDPARFVGAIR